MEGCRTWARAPVRDRLEVVRRLRALVADEATALARTVQRDVAETLVAEVLPLAEACRFSTLR